MNPSRICRRAALVLIAFVLATRSGLAQLDLPAPPRATLLRLTLQPGGSITPPGDRLVAALLLYPGTNQVDLELEAESVVESTDATAKVAPSPVPVRARSSVPQGTDGRFRLRTSVIGRGGAATTVEVALIVPTASLDLEPEGHLVRYVLRGSVAGAEVFTTATRLIAPGEGGSSHLTSQAALSPTLAVPSKRLPTPTLVDPVADVPETMAPDRSFAIVRKRPILFATNRKPHADSGTPSARFGDEPDAEVYHGSCLVNVPVDRHIQGQLELPGWFTGRDPNRFFLIDATTRLAPEAFADMVRGTETRGDILVYVHGFNTSFDFAVLRLAQVVEDIRFGGVPVVFSWPSQGSVWSYGTDETYALASVKALADTLARLVEIQASRPEGRRGKVHVLAHSLGNRVALRALEQLDRRLEPGQKPFGQIILAAPDVSVAEFSQRVPASATRAERVSLYFCPDDEALLASEARHPAEPRAGRDIVPIAGIDNIDARKANTSFLGHGYWADVKQLLIDLQQLINLSWSPTQREMTLRPAFRPPNFAYWAFP